jgi:hypothetical protein
MDFRTRVLMQRAGITDPAIARREIERSDAAHNGTMQRLFGVDWRDAELYAATLNTERVTPDACVEHIARLVESDAFRETPASRGALRDRVVTARVHSALRNRFSAGPKAMGVEVKVEEGHVTLTGAVSDERIIAELVRLAGSVEGAERVESRIQYLSFARDPFLVR